eukprot:2802401-Rhodomonas_salina.1
MKGEGASSITWSHHTLSQYRARRRAEADYTMPVRDAAHLLVAPLDRALALLVKSYAVSLLGIA